MVYSSRKVVVVHSSPEYVPWSQYLAPILRYAASPKGAPEDQHHSISCCSSSSTAVKTPTAVATAVEQQQEHQAKQLGPLGVVQRWCFPGGCCLCWLAISVGLVEIVGNRLQPAQGVPKSNKYNNSSSTSAATAKTTAQQQQHP